MKTSINTPKRSKVLEAQQIKTPQVPVPQQSHDIPRPKSVPTTTAKPTLEDIAKRAYEIYVENGCQQGQCEENWKQAEQELKKGVNIVSV